jgi:hypothetical protein
MRRASNEWPSRGPGVLVQCESEFRGTVARSAYELVP